MARYELYEVCGGTATIEAESMEEATAAWREWIEDGDYGDRQETCWIYGEVTPLDDDGERLDDETESMLATLEPDEPDCDEEHIDHDWRSPYHLVGGCRENPGVFGHGGGVVIHEVCRHCGCLRVTDTWAQDPSNGRQGLTSVEYRPGEFAEESAELEGDD